MISPSDHCSAWTAKANNRVQFCYRLNFLVDLENAVVIDVEPTPTPLYDEVESTKPLLRLLGLNMPVKAVLIPLNNSPNSLRNKGCMALVRGRSQFDPDWQHHSTPMNQAFMAPLTACNCARDCL